MKKLVLASLVCVLLLLAPFTLLDQVSTGLPPYGSFSGGPDVTNLGNLNLHYTFPVFSKPGRGMPFNYTLSFDSLVWYPSANAWTPVANWGWGGPTDSLTGRLSVFAITNHCFDDSGNRVNYKMWTFIQFRDGHGVVHPILGADSQQGTACSDAITDVGVAIDGSGYTVVPNAGAGTATVIAPSGQIISNVPTGVGFGSATVSDSNGNQITANGGTFTDTLGMNVLTPPAVRPIR